MHDDGPRASERWQLIACAVMGAILVLLFFLTPVPDRARGLAPSTVVTTGDGSSCVSTVQGWSSGTLDIGTSTDRLFRFKCYYGGTGPGAGFFTSTSGLATCPTVAPVYLVIGANLGGAVTCSTYTSPLVIDVSAPGYVEFHFTGRLSGSGVITRDVTPSGIHVRTAAGTYLGLGTTGTSGGGPADPETGHWVWSIDFDTAMPPYRWGDEYIDSRCKSLDMYIDAPGRTFAPGEFAFVEWLGATPEDIGDGVVSLRYRWAPHLPFVSLWQRAGVLNPVPPIEPTPVRNNDTVPHNAVTLEIECRDPEGGVYYLRGDSSWSGTPQQPRACAALTVTWPPVEAFYDEDEAAQATLTIADTTDDEIEALTFSISPGLSLYSDEVSQVRDTSTTTWVDPLGDLVSLPIGAGQYIASFSFEAAWTPDDGLALSCEDSAGRLNLPYSYPRGIGKGVDDPDDDYDRRFSECIGNTGFGIRPSSWVPGLLKGTSCVLQVVFVPIQSDVDSLVDGANEIRNKAPIGYVEELGGYAYDVVDDTPAALAAHREDCTSVPLPEFGGGEDDAELCLHEMTGPWAEMRFFAGAGMWAAWSWWGWGAIRRNIA